jgi:dynein heavy chain
MRFCTSKKIPFSHDFTVERILGDPVNIRQWNIQGLPADNLSVENGIIVTEAKRWPLIIDPQSQGNRWIKNMEKENQLQVTKLSNIKFLQIVENGIRLGNPVLIENIDEQLDPALEPVLLKNVVKSPSGLVIKLGDNEVPYSPEFKFYISTKLANPHYLPEICIKVCIINFTVTPEGLED